MKIVGHRGASGLAPENTLTAIRKGLLHHSDELEFDLRVTRDGEVILHHDSQLKDGSGKTLEVHDHTLAELRSHKPDLTTFEEVLDGLGPNVPLHIEVKAGEPVGPIVKSIKARLRDGWAAEHFLLGSKSQPILLELHAALPDIKKIVIEPWSGVRATRRARQLDTKLLSMNQLWLWAGFIKPLSRRGWKLYAYTLNDPKKAKRWASYGLYGVITDYPDRFDHESPA